MENITKVAQKIYAAFTSSGTITCVTSDSGEGYASSVDDNIEIEEDNHRDQWFCEFRVEGGTHLPVKETLTALFGKGKVQPRSDTAHGVDNWTVGTVKIVHLGNSIELFEYFDRKPKKR